VALQVKGVNQPDSLGLLRVDLWTAVCTLAVAQGAVVVEGDYALLHALPLPQDDVLPDGLALRLGEAAEQRNQELAGLRQCVDVLFFKDDADTPVLEGADDLEAVHRVPSETGGGFRKDHVNAAPFAGGNHAVELGPLFHTGAAQTLVRKNTSHLPIGVLLDFLRVIILLGGVTVELFLAVGGYPAVGGDPLFTAVPGAADGGHRLGGGNDTDPPLYSLFHMTPSISSESRWRDK